MYLSYLKLKTNTYKEIFNYFKNITSLIKLV